MAVETYTFDEPVGLYGMVSHERLAQGVVQDLIRYEETAEAANVYELPYLGVHQPVTEKFVISSIVESSDARDGYIFTAGRPNKTSMGGTLYHINRQGPDVLGTKTVAVNHPATFKSNEDYRKTVQELVEGFEKSELEIVTRTLVKMTISIEHASKLQVVDEDMLDGLSIASRMKQEADINRSRAILQKNAAVEPFVLSALHNHNRQTRQNSPAEGSLVDKRDEYQSTEHVLDWEEFALAINDLLEQGEIQKLPGNNVNLNYEIGSKIYYIRLATRRGMISGIQMLCDDLGAWKSQSFDLDSGEADYSGRNNLNNMWNKSEVLACIQDGEIIDDEAYDQYRKLAEQSIRTRFASPEREPIQLKIPQEKRPAA